MGSPEVHKLPQLIFSSLSLCLSLQAHPHTCRTVSPAAARQTKPFICVPVETITPSLAAQPDRQLLGINDVLMVQVKERKKKNKLVILATVLTDTMATLGVQWGCCWKPLMCLDLI